MLACEGSEQCVSLLTLAEVVRGSREIDHERGAGAGGLIGRAFGNPDVLANRDTNQAVADADEERAIASKKRTLLIENAVVR